MEAIATKKGRFQSEKLLAVHLWHVFIKSHYSHLSSPKNTTTKMLLQNYFSPCSLKDSTPVTHTRGYLLSRFSVIQANVVPPVPALDQRGSRAMQVRTTSVLAVFQGNCKGRLRPWLALFSGDSWAPIMNIYHTELILMSGICFLPVYTTYVFI